MKKILLSIYMAFMIFSVNAQILTSTTDLSVTKTWYQEEGGYSYPTFVHVPDIILPEEGFPVCLLLHGNGGNGEGMLNGNKNKFKDHVLVAVSGYEKSWNMSDEKSDAPDIEMIDELITKIQSYKNINPNKIRILGSSNGGGLCNRIFIEIDNPGIDIICSIVSQLSNVQYREGKLFMPSINTGKRFENLGYDTEKIPVKGRRFLGITNENDPLIPYAGGLSRVGVTFIHSQLAAFVIAKTQGYQGEQLSEEGTDIGNELKEYKYLGGQVIHLKGQNGHGSSWAVNNYIKNYFATEMDVTDVENEEEEEEEEEEEGPVMDLGQLSESIKIYPNPSCSYLQIEGFKENKLKYKILTLDGKVMLVNKVKSNTQVNQIDISSLKTGTYIILVNGQKTKFIKQ